MTLTRSVLSSPPPLSLTLTSSSLRDCLTLAHLATTSHVISLSWRNSPPRPRSCVPPVHPSASCRTHSLSSQRTFHLIFLALLLPSARQLLPSPPSRPLQRCSALTHPRSLSRRSALPPPPSTLSMPIPYRPRHTRHRTEERNPLPLTRVAPSLAGRKQRCGGRSSKWDSARRRRCRR